MNSDIRSKGAESTEQCAIMKTSGRRHGSRDSLSAANQQGVKAFQWSANKHPRRSNKSSSNVTTIAVTSLQTATETLTTATQLKITDNLQNQLSQNWRRLSHLPYQCRAWDNRFAAPPSSPLLILASGIRNHYRDRNQCFYETSGSRMLYACVVLLSLCCWQPALVHTSSLAQPQLVTNPAPSSSPSASDARVNIEPNGGMTVDESDSWRTQAASMRDLRDARLGDKINVNMSNVFEVIFKKRPYSKYWTVEQKWDDLFKRMMAVQGTLRQMMMKNFMRDIEYYADLSISPQCEKDLKFIQNYARQSTNLRWLTHMFDSTGKSEPGMLTGMLAHLGHPVQCINVRAPAGPSNETFDERFFELQTAKLGERFRGKYCLASIRPVMPRRPRLVSRFSNLMNDSMLSNVSYSGQSVRELKIRARQLSVPADVHHSIDREHVRLDQVPFESELYQYLIAQRNFMFTLPRLLGVCYPSSCTRDDVRISLQKSVDDQHQVVDIEFECEQAEMNAWDFFVTQRLLAYVFLGLITFVVLTTSLMRYVLLSKLQIKRSRLAPESRMANLLNALDMFSMDKCAGILFIKTQRASPIVDWTKVENNRSTSIDALRGFLVLVLIYSQMIVLGCLPLPFMWSKWSDAMFPFFRSLVTQLFLNMSIWSEAFYMISAYLIALKCLENLRPKVPAGTSVLARPREGASMPNFFAFAIKRYIRLIMPVVAFILFNYVWPRLSNGFIFQDQAEKLMKPCDKYGWTNMLLFHNYYSMNETCLWPSHVSASFFQLHLLSYPLIAMCLRALHIQHGDYYDEGKLSRRRKILVRLLTYGSFGAMALLALIGAVHSATEAAANELIVPFLIDYIDFDNYRRVLEWMVLPTYNHLTSYMFGLVLAFIVARRKAANEFAKCEASEWFGSSAGDGRGSSSGSVRSSSTQELQDGLTFKSSSKFQVSSPAPSSVYNSCLKGGHEGGENGDYDSGDDDDDNYHPLDASLNRQARGSKRLWRIAGSLFSFTLMLVTLLSSWLWNGLGQPMTSAQTFWWVLLTKLCFCLTFAHLFHEHFATRRNSSNPWMVTRFLVPIGRMSLIVFYMSWLVIWFDLLSSLYQWHPSHYFIFEKYNEIIFMTLILSMFVYGAFEGIIKRIQYAGRLERVKQDAELVRGAQAEKSLDSLAQPPQSRYRFLRVKAFESFFNAPDKWTSASDDEGEHNRQFKPGMGGDKLTNQSEGVMANNLTAQGLASSASGVALSLQQQKAGGRQSTSGERGVNLSPSDRCMLNAELRANYSFASIGLYENAGATGDLSVLNSSDPQASPAMNQKR